MAHPIRPARGWLPQLGQLAVVCLLAVALAACGEDFGHSSAAVSGSTGSVAAYGSVALQARWPAQQPATRSQTPSASGRFAEIPPEVVTVRVIVSAADLVPPIQRDFDASLRYGVVDHIPVGTRTLTLQGLNASGVAHYQGSVSEVVITAGAVADAGTVVLSSLAPATPPALTSPATLPVTGNTAPLTVSGTCTSAPPHTVHISGAQSDSTPCTNGTFSFVLKDPGADGVYEYAIKQTRDDSGLSSASVNFAWTLDRTAPGAPQITDPATASVTSAGSALALAGQCESGSTVTLSGDADNSAVCTAGAFSFSVGAASDGTRTYTLRQTDAAGNASGVATVQWVRDATVPGAPAIGTPAVSPSYTNDAVTAFTISGTCTASPAHTINLSGAATGSQPCGGGGTYSFSVANPGTDGSYSYSVSQTRDATGLSSSPAAVVITLDTATPGAPGVTAPSGSPYTSAASSLTLSGTCETNAAVQLSGAAAGTQTCASGGYNFIVNAASDGTYNYAIAQTDLAGNASPPAAVQWVRDTTVPGAPTIGAPAASPSYTNDAVTAFTISGACTGSPGHTVTLAGAATASQPCTGGGTYSFSVTNPGTPASYAYNVTQTRNANGQTGPAAPTTIVLDTTAPVAPGVSSPGSSPVTTAGSSLTLGGTCEASATVTLSGSATGSQGCSGGLFNFTANAASDATYTYSLVQMDLAGNVSPAAAVQWLRDTTVPGAPTIGTPAASPSYTNDTVTAFTISGTCTASPGHTVNLGGAATASQPCSGGTYSFSVTNPGTPGSYTYNVTQTRSANGLTGPAASATIVLDTTAPAAPVVTAPASSPHTSAGSSLTLGGTCEVNATVTLAGSATGSQSCGAGTFSFTANAASDGTYNYSLTQTDPAGNTSPAAAVQWVRDSTVPGTPTIGTPATSPVYTNDAVTAFTISGTCTSSPAHTVNLGGAATASQACGGGTYSFSVTNPGTGGSYTYNVTQTRVATGLTSGAASATIILDTTAPAAPVVTAPASSPVTTAGSSLTLGGTCEANATMTLSGSATGSQSCGSGTFSFTVNAASDATYTYSLVQTDLAGNTSPAAAVQWVRDTTVPTAPGITTPAASPYYGNATPLTLSGTCTGSPAHTVNLAGTQTGSIACGGGTYSFSLANPGADATYAYSVTQTRDATGIGSSATAFSWVLDRVAPAAPVVTAPASSPVTTAGSSLTLGGTCEVNATVTLSGSATGTQVCGAGTFSFTANAASDGTYNYALTQTDRAGNTSTGAAVQWVRDTTVPGAPGITTPASTPHYGNATPLTLGGTCTSSPAHTVNLAGTQTGTVSCGGGTYTFSLANPGIDGTYGYTVTQTRDATGLTSSATPLSWVLDRVAPAAPTVTAPAGSPYVSSSASLTLSGACETNATVHLGGSSTANVACIGSSYSFTVTPVADGTYTYSLTQTDLAGNTSPATTQQWERATTPPGAPAITSPASSPHYGNTAPLALSGTCTSAPAHTVNLSGTQTASTACSGGTFAFSLSNPGSDATYGYTVKQTRDATGLVSAGTAFSWVLDTTPPAAPPRTTPASSPFVSGGTSLTISGNCEAGATVNLGGSATATTACSSGSYSFTVTPVSDGTYTYSLTQTDLAGNTSSSTPLQWERASTPPPAPGITSPASSPHTGNTGPLTLSGTCIAAPAHTVALAGTQAGSVACVGGAYSFSLTTPGADGSYSYTVTQTRVDTGLTSTATGFAWVLDTAAPPAPVVTAPASSPFVSSASSLTISGTCESGATVNMSGSATGSQGCGGTFSFTVNAASDGTYDYAFTQTDGAGNASPAANFQWVRGAPGFTVVPITVSITEGGIAKTFDVNLDTPPSGDVVVKVLSLDTTEATVDKATLTFTSGNWSVAQTVTVTPVDDAVADGNQSVPVRLTVDQVATADAIYDLLDPADVTVTVVDNDAIGITVTPTSGLFTSEAGGTAQFTVGLNSAPNGNVAIDLASGNVAEVTVSTGQLVFTTGNWSTARTVTLTGVDDLIADGTQAVVIALTINPTGTADTTGYAALNPADVSVSNTDNDAIGVTVSPTAGLTTTESGGSATFSVVLNTQPNGNVVVAVASSNYAEVNHDKSQLTFTTVNWNTAQVVTVSGVDDAIVDGNQPATILLTINTGLTGDTTGYAGLNPADVSVTNVDNDTLGVTITPSTGLQTDEYGATTSFTVVLDSPPNNDVVINIASANTAEVTVTPAQLIFTTANWSITQTVTAQGVNDSLTDGDKPVNVTLSTNPGTLDTTGYASLVIPPLVVTNLDNEAFSEGAPGAPVPLGTGLLPYTGGTSTAASSYYLVSGLSPGVTYLVTSSSLTQDVRLYVYSDVNFTTQLCTSNQYSWPGPEACLAAANANGDLYVRVLNQSGTYGADFAIDVRLPPSSQGTSGSPVAIAGLLPYVGTVGPGGDSYFVVTGTGTATWYASLTGMSEDLNLYVYTNSGFSTLTCSSTASTIAESCNATSTANALYIRVRNTAGGIGATFNLDVRSLPAAEGTSASPIVLTGLLPYRGEMDGTAGSYYAVTGLVANASYTVSLTSVSKDVRLRVYSNSAFSTLLCNSDSPVSSPEYCSVNANTFGQLFIRVNRGSSNTGGALYTLDVQ